LPLTSRIGTKPLRAFPLGFLALLFFVSTQRRFPHPSPSVCSTSVLPFSWNVLGYVSAIGLVVAPGLHSSRMERDVSPERWFTLGDPARSDDEKTPNRNFP